MVLWLAGRVVLFDFLACVGVLQKVIVKTLYSYSALLESLLKVWGNLESCREMRVKGSAM